MTRMGRSIGVIRGILDVTAFCAAIWAAYYIRFLSGLIPLLEHQPFSFYLDSALVVLPLYVFVLFTMGNYYASSGRLNQYMIQNLLRSILLFYILCGVATFAVHSQLHSRLMIVLSFLFNVLFCLIFRRLLLAWRVHRWREGLDLEKILLIGKDRKVFQEFKGEFPDQADGGYKIERVQIYSEEHEIDLRNIDTILLIGDFTFSEIADIVLDTTDRIRVDFIPTYYVFLRMLPFREQIGSYPVLPLNRKILSDWSAVAKRTMDIMVAGALLILLSPVVLLISLLIAISYGRPIFYHQKRVGQNGSPFKLYKFRTMKKDADKEVSPMIVNEKQTIFKWKDDPRVENALARFLRRTALDELPQLWNVLEGTMSLVGPRPATTELVRNYSAEHKLRLSIPPGITGLQQVNCRGSISMEEVLKYDLQYISQQSLWLDLYILTRTVSTLILGKGTS